MNTDQVATHILVAEDAADVRIFLVRVLARIKPDARISEVKNGVEALELFQTTRCDLIISDHRMPIMSGLDLLIAVRQVSSVPFIMISADGQVSQQAIEAGANEFFTKPVGLTILRAIVLNLLPAHLT